MNSNLVHTDNVQALFGRYAILATAKIQPVSPSVSQSVSHRAADGQLTDAFGVGWAVQATARTVLPALVSHVVNMPIATIEPLEQYGRIVVAQVTPMEDVDPVLPFVIGPRSATYQYWYRCYWKALLRYIGASWIPGTRRRVESAARRLVMQLPLEGLTERERAYFMVWLAHGPLGEYQFIDGRCMQITSINGGFSVVDGRQCARIARQTGV